MKPMRALLIYLGAIVVLPIAVGAQNPTDRLVKCAKCPNELEISGLQISGMATVGEYLILLPQKKDALYVYLLSELKNYFLSDIGKSQSPNETDLQLRPVRIFAKKSGWEAVASRQLKGNQYALYLAFEDAKKSKSIFYETTIVLPNQGTNNFSPKPLQLKAFDSLEGNGNSSYEGISWLPAKNGIPAGLLAVPETTFSGLQPYVLHGNGTNPTMVRLSDSLDRYRIADIAPIDGDPLQLVGTSSCFVPLDYVPSDPDSWEGPDPHCFAPGEERRSKLLLLRFELQAVQDYYEMAVISVKTLDITAISPPGPPDVYNAEGVVWTSGGVLMVNDNDPGTAITTIRIIPQ